MLILVAQHNHHTVQINYVLAFPQMLIEHTLCIEIPKGFELPDGHDEKYCVLNLHQTVYGNKNTGRTWYQYLSQKPIEEVRFVQSNVDECVFYKGMVMYILYTDNLILAGPDQNEILQVISQIQVANLNITVEGDIQDFLGINKHERG
jgi:Reverse transcriptase (RNA-dependent DNA polymerase)